MSVKVYVPLLLAALTLAFGGCGKDKDKQAQGEKTSNASVKDFVPKLDEAKPKAELPVADVTPKPTAPPPADISPEKLEKVGKLLDESSNIMQDLALLFSSIKDIQTASEAAPKITEKVATLNAINKESIAVGVDQDVGQSQFPEKYQVLKQTSLLIQGHMQRIYLDAPTYQIVTEAWKKGQETGAPLPTASSAKPGSGAAAGTAAQTTPAQTPPAFRNRLRSYQQVSPGTPPVLMSPPSGASAPSGSSEGGQGAAQSPPASQTPSTNSGQPPPAQQ